MPTTIDALKKLGLVAIVGSVTGAPALAIGFWLMTTIGIIPSDDLGTNGFVAALVLEAITIGIALDRLDGVRGQYRDQNQARADGQSVLAQDVPTLRALYVRYAVALIALSVVIIPVVTSIVFS
jgi:hypothetical protein